MSIGVVGSYPTAPAAPAARPVSGGATPVPGNYGYAPDAYNGLAATPGSAAAAYPGYPQPIPPQALAQQPGATAAGFNIGRVASWGLGALGAAKFILPHLSGGWLKIAFVGVGALVGNFVWNKFEKDVPADKAGGIGHMGTIAGGGVGALMLGRAVLGANPAGWLIGGIVAGGAFLGHKLYAMMQKP